MKRTALTACVVALLASLVFATCPEQTFLSVEDLDPNQIATDPVSGEKLVFLKLSGYTGNLIEVDGYVCDADNDDPNATPQELTVWRVTSSTGDSGTGIQALELGSDDTWQFTVTYTTDGWHYETVSVSDGIATRTGTVAIRTTTNRPPSLCGGQP